MKKGLVLEGGTMRGMFTCGVMDKKDRGAKVGMWISGIVIAYVLIMSLAVVIF